MYVEHHKSREQKASRTQSENNSRIIGTWAAAGRLIKNVKPSDSTISLNYMIQTGEI